jgi:S1-C subfamily serine protease
VHALLLTALLPLLPGAGEITPELIQKVKGSVVRIKGLDAAGDVLSVGSGFVVDGSGVVATNKHVLDVGGATLVAEFRDGTKKKVLGEVGYSPKRDVALVQIEGDGYAPLALGTTEGLQEGTPILLVGAPMNLGWTVTTGFVSAVREHGVDKDMQDGEGEVEKYDDPNGKLVQLNVSSAQGASGSPVVNAAGEVVGIFSSGMGVMGNLEFAIPVEALREALLLKGTQQPDPLKASRPVEPIDATAHVRWRNLGISAAFFVATGVLLAVRRRRAAAPAPRRRR